MVYRLMPRRRKGLVGYWIWPRRAGQPKKKSGTSQLDFAKRATRWEQDYITNRKMVFDHYWGPNAKRPI